MSDDLRAAEQLDVNRLKCSAEKLSIYGSDVIASLSLASEYNTKDIAYLAFDVAEALLKLLAEHPADDGGSPITRQTMEPLGFTWSDDWSSYNGGWEARMQMPEPFHNCRLIFREHETLFATGPSYWACPTAKTMNDVRDLAKCLGVELKEQSR